MHCSWKLTVKLHWAVCKQGTPLFSMDNCIGWISAKHLGHFLSHVFPENENYRKYTSDKPGSIWCNVGHILNNFSCYQFSIFWEVCTVCWWLEKRILLFCPFCNLYFLLFIIHLHPLSHFNQSLRDYYHSRNVNSVQRLQTHTLVFRDMAGLLCCQRVPCLCNQLASWRPLHSFWCLSLDQFWNQTIFGNRIHIDSISGN